MDKIILKFVFLFTPLLERLGVDSGQLEIILKTKLIMDDRRPFAFSGRKQKQNKEPKNSFLMASVFLLIMGCFMAALLNLGRGNILGNTMYISMFMIIIVITLVSDFSSVLIDVRDNNIILPRPVSDRTFTVSRILHITIHVFKMVFVLSLPGIICEAVLDGPTALFLFIIEIQLASVFSIFLVNLLYLAILTFSSPEKFNNVISYFQIAFSIIIFAAYQVLPQLTRRLNFENIDPLIHPYTWILPPVWFASFFDVIEHPQAFSILKLTLGTLGLLVPFAAIYFVVKVMAPGFSRRLSSISPNGEEAVPGTIPSAPESRNQPGLAEKLSLVLSSNKVEQAGFKLTWWLTSRYRDFKVKVYPSFAYVPVYFVYLFFLRPGSDDKDMSLADMKNGSGYITLLYLTSFVLIAVLQQISQSEKYKAAWVMFSTAHNEPGKILSGMFKAIVCKYFIPYYIIISLFGLFVWGPTVINDIILAFFCSMIYGMILAIFTIDYLPFSQPVTNQAGKSFVRFLFIFAIAIFGFAHYLVVRWEWAVNALLVCSVLACVLVFNYFRKRDWDALEADYN